MEVTSFSLEEDAVKAMPPTANIVGDEASAFEDVPLERLESEITELAAHLNAAECRWLLLVAEFDRRQGWSTWECRSCAHWLNWKCGLDLTTGREKVRVAHCLRQLPTITAAFAAGRLSSAPGRRLGDHGRELPHQRRARRPQRRSPSGGGPRRCRGAGRRRRGTLQARERPRPRCRDRSPPGLRRRRGWHRGGRAGHPLDVGRKTRSIPPAIRRALQARDGGCRFPGCSNRCFVDGHHIRHWAAGGETSLANLVLVCRRHHRAVHEGGYTAEAPADPHDPVRFHRPDGTVLGDQCELPTTDHRAVVDHNRRLRLDIDHLTAMPTWAGERLDLGLCVDALLSSSLGLPTSVTPAPPPAAAGRS